MNNFDMNSKGFNLEFTGCFDGYLSQINFEENFKFTDNHACIFIDNGNCDQVRLKVRLKEGVTIQEFLKIAVSIQYPSLTPYEGYKMLMRDDCPTDSWRDLIEDDIISFLVNDCLNCCEGELHIELQKYGHDILDTNFTIINVTDCRGADSEVILFDKVKEDFKEGFDFKTMFEDYFHRAPISGELIINGEWYRIDECLNNSYEWNKQEFLENFIKQGVQQFTPEQIEELNNFIPEDLEYTS